MTSGHERTGPRPINPVLYVLETRRAATARQSSEAQNTGLVQQLYQTAMEDNLSGLLELCAPDAVWEYPPIKGVAWSRTWQGHEEIARWAELHDAEDAVLDLRPEEYLADGDRVIVLGFARMRTVATGGEWATRFVHAVRIHDRKIQRFEAFFDTAACVEAHGLVAAG